MSMIGSVRIVSVCSRLLSQSESKPAPAQNPLERRRGQMVQCYKDIDSSEPSGLASYLVNVSLYCSDRCCTQLRQIIPRLSEYCGTSQCFSELASRSPYMSSDASRLEATFLSCSDRGIVAATMSTLNESAGRRIWVCVLNRTFPRTTLSVSSLVFLQHRRITTQRRRPLFSGQAQRRIVICGWLDLPSCNASSWEWKGQSAA